jgi:hypothetical protein
MQVTEDAADKKLTPHLGGPILRDGGWLGDLSVERMLSTSAHAVKMADSGSIRLEGATWPAA